MRRRRRRGAVRLRHTTDIGNLRSPKKPIPSTASAESTLAAKQAESEKAAATEEYEEEARCRPLPVGQST